MNEQQKIEELLKPRYEVIAPYPAYKGHGIEVGDILTDPGGRECVRNQKGQAVAAFDWDMFPHLFKPLPWYAKRSVEEIPEYVKFSRNGIVIKPVHIDADLGYFYITDKEFIDNDYHLLADTLPATESEYTAYINSKR